jgi:hypothetical protein
MPNLGINRSVDLPKADKLAELKDILFHRLLAQL